MVGACLTCGARADLEAHHVAGRHNHATLTVAVCVDCHHILSTWQQAAGTELHHDAPTGDLDASRALLVGVVHLIQMYGQRHPESWVPAPVAVHTARAISKLLNGVGAADRPGRWLPDPTVTPGEATPVQWPSTTEVERIRDMAHLANYLQGLLGEVSPQLTEALAGAAARPAEWADAFHRAAANEETTRQVALVVTNYIDLSAALMVRLLHVDDLNTPDQGLLQGLADWFRSAHHLLDTVLAVAANPAPVRT